MKYETTGKIIAILGFCSEVILFVATGYYFAFGDWIWFPMLILALAAAIGTGEVIRILGVINYLNKHKGGTDGIQTKTETA